MNQTAKQHTVRHFAATQAAFRSKRMKAEVSEAADTGSEGVDYAEEKIKEACDDVGEVIDLASYKASYVPYAVYRKHIEKRVRNIKTTDQGLNNVQRLDAPFVTGKNQETIFPEKLKDVANKESHSTHGVFTRDQLKKLQIRKALHKSLVTQGKHTAASNLKRTSSLTKRMNKATKKVGHKVIKLTVRLIAAVGKALVSLLAGGGVALILLVGIGSIAAIIGSPMGVLLSGELTDPNAITIPSIVQRLNVEFGEAINNVVAEHPECSESKITYSYENNHTWSSYWPEVIAIFAVRHNQGVGEDVVMIDSAKAGKLEDVFWEMHRIESHTETRQIIVEVPDDEDDSTSSSDQSAQTEIQYINTLFIDVSSRSVEELARKYRFTSDQRDILNQLLSPEMRPSLEALCSVHSLPQETGLKWPLPGYTSISTQFGVPDAYGKPGHKGIDIPAAAGTPVLSAHSGTVMIAGWNDSYGNQVVVDNGAGICTRYAHLSSIAVSPGQSVSEGEALGGVGSTGNSTGNHLHFEVSLNGTLIDPLTVVLVG